ncbi:protein farnesyltransferase subunit alpha, putative [Plasmodium malariae]|uniref:Protein farnesyltransferase/geranylgeranyltransferase type-1 subunit alpha n=1 Tax=Plasmodium malariae TaxID=5858 RepID=A0A1C3L3D2_PLAMA|nr:protein farnesyltransferase subunit alpha, putative [Plasmodium malariae]
MDRQNLNVYAREFNLNYPETLDGLNFHVLNNPLFNLISKKKFIIDITDLEREQSKCKLESVDGDEAEEEEEEEYIKDKGKINLLNTYYTDNEILLYSLLGSLIEDKVYSFEGYIVSTFVIKINSSYYSAWIYRRKCLKKLNLNFINDLKFTKFIISDNIKSFQSWFHRRWLVEYIYKLNMKKVRVKQKGEDNSITSQRNKEKDDEMIKTGAPEAGESGHTDVTSKTYFDDDSNFISNDEEESNISSTANPFEETSSDEGFISNCEHTDFEIKREDVNLYDDLQNIIENSTFFKNALEPNEEININEFLYEEILYNNCDIFIDTKNYNSWAHKTWLIDKFSILKNDYLCEKYNILLHEFNYINYFLKYKEKDKDKNKEYTKDIFQISIINNLKNELTKLKAKSKFLLIFLSQLYAYNGSYYDESQCYRYLERNDDFNNDVWKCKIEYVGD